ncbi:hypothetical protein BG011_002348 [Mortierella polycephala]|uniref:Extracellular membrane protein CFEM domain-containing protein n=1 Tax=Mortierella polycephala TaxID=41804 RepID=A0A9P6Q3G4_9FUNG|nr:hypothetical protein BG011_002348 [Mortierella polycephala]
MRTSKSLLLALCLSLIRASHAATDSSNNQQQQQYTEATEEDVERFKDGLRQMIAQLPIQPIEPLVATMDGYCTAFESLCSTICSERTTDGNESEETAIGCADPKAISIVHADASCKCAGFDLTTRVNFALVGGVVTSKGSNLSDFNADGILDGLTFLPGVSSFVGLIEIMQNACHYVGYLDILVTDKNKAGLQAGIGGALGNLLGGVIAVPTNIIGGLGNVLGGLTGFLGGGSSANSGGSPGTGAGGGSGWLEGIFGGGKPATTTVASTSTAGGGGWFNFFSRDTATIPTLMKTTTQTSRTTNALVVSAVTTLTKAAATKSTSIAAKPATTTTKGFFDFIPFDESEEGAEDHDHDQDKNKDQDLDTRPIDHEGRVARSVRAKKRYAEKVSKEQDRNDL